MPTGRSKQSKQMWVCPGCDREFAHRNQWHSCVRYTIDEHLEGKSAAAIALYRRFADLAQECGPVKVVPVKTRIGFQVRMTFAAVSLTSDSLKGHLVLARRIESPRFTRIESPSPRNHIHQFLLRSLEEMDEEFRAWLQEAYQVGQQRHLQHRIV